MHVYVTTICRLYICSTMVNVPCWKHLSLSETIVYHLAAFTFLTVLSITWWAKTSIIWFWMLPDVYVVFRSALLKCCPRTLSPALTLKSKRARKLPWLRVPSMSFSRWVALLQWPRKGIFCLSQNAIVLTIKPSFSYLIRQSSTHTFYALLLICWGGYVNHQI